MVLLTGLTGLIAPLQAQLAPPGGEQQQPIVEQIDIEFAGAQAVSRQAILAHMRLRVGSPFSQVQLDQSIRSLYETGLYEFIEVRRRRLSDNKVALTLVIVPKFRVTAVIFRGNDEYSERRLQGQIETRSGGVLDEVQIKRDADKLFQFYQDRGYSRAKVDYTIQRDESLGTGTVTFTIDEGAKIHISTIQFTGNENVSARTLRRQMKTDTWTPVISWITGNGRFKEKEFQDDLEKLRRFMKNQGYLDVEIPESGVIFDYPEPGEMVITIAITEGRQYRVGTVSVSGNKIFPTDRLMSILFIRPNDIFSPERVDRNVEAIQDYYGAVGYLDTFIRAERIPNLDTGDIDLNFSISEGDRFFVESINIQGNTKTKSNVIVRELALAPGDVFDLVRMKNSQARLQNTRFFDEVNLAPEATNIPGRRNLRITVKEGRTGNLTFGAGFSSVESIVGFVELSQSNFDAFNYKNMFQGAGQKFRLRVSIGTESNQILLAFEEPWVFERELAFGFELYRTETDYLSTDYNELRMGVQFYFRKRLFELVEGRLSYTIEQVTIKDVAANAPAVIQNEQGTRSVSKVGFTLTRDTRDNLVMPTRGNRVQLFQEVAGGPLLGQTNYYRIEGRAGQWWPTFEFGEQVFSLIGRTGSITGYGGKDVPFFDRYFLGGAYSLRGFKFRRVGPIDQASNEPLGGNTFAFASAEYSIEVVNPVRFAVFYDWGFVNSNSWNFDPSQYNDDFGVGLRILILGAPLRLDVGFPITTGPLNDNGVQFNFSFGTVF